MMPSDSGSRRAASGGALERRKTATASRTMIPATINSVRRVRLCIRTGRACPLRASAPYKHIEPGPFRRGGSAKRARSVFHRHRVRINGFLSGNSFEPRQQAPVIAFVGLECKAALFPGVVPSKTHEMLLRLGKSHQGSDA